MSENGLSKQRLFSFKEIDLLHQRPKGTAFRVFKRLAEQLVEGVDFHCLDASTQAAEIDALRREGRLYAATVNAVLLTEAGYERVRRSLQESS